MPLPAWPTRPGRVATTRSMARRGSPRADRDGTRHVACDRRSNPLAPTPGPLRIRSVRSARVNHRASISSESSTSMQVSRARARKPTINPAGNGHHLGRGYRHVPVRNSSIVPLGALRSGQQATCRICVQPCSPVFWALGRRRCRSSCAAASARCARCSPSDAGYAGPARQPVAGHAPGCVAGQSSSLRTAVRERALVK
jgi:hypothetical protein